MPLQGILGGGGTPSAGDNYFYAGTCSCMMLSLLPVVVWICSAQDCSSTSYVISGIVSGIGLAILCGTCALCIKDCRKEHDYTQF